MQTLFKLSWGNAHFRQEAQGLIAGGVPFLITDVDADLALTDCLKFLAYQNCHCQFDPILRQCLVTPLAKAPTANSSSATASPAPQG